MEKRKNKIPEAIVGDTPFDIKLEEIRIIKKTINAPEDFSYDNSKKDLEATLTISLKLKDVDATVNNRELIEVSVCFNSHFKGALLVEFEALNIFSISNNKLHKLLHKRNVNDTIISFIINNAIAQTRGIYQLEISNTKIHRVSIPLVTLKDLKEIINHKELEPSGSK